MTLFDLETPALVLDATRMDANIRRMRERMSRLGMALRPHVKTNKCVEITLRLCGGQPAPITVSTLKEAEQFFAAGYVDILYAVGITPNKLDHVIALRRAGVFVFFDLVMAGIEVCRSDDIALSALVSVIGHQQEKGWIITDGGWMALSRDRGTAKQGIDQGYGVVCDVRGEPIPNLIVSDANQEHGVLSFRNGGVDVRGAFPVGILLCVLPNHACATAGQHDRYHVVRGTSAEVETVWPRFGGW